MRTDPPADFDVENFYRGVRMFQKWDVFEGHSIGTGKDVVEHLGRLDAPARMDGLRVLEIAPWNGFFGFECLRRGARELVSLGPDDPEDTYFHKTVELLDIKDRTTYVRASVYNINEYDLGQFDIVLFLGLIYHLRHPLLALDLLHDCCVDKGTFLIDSPVADAVGRIGTQDTALGDAWTSVQQFPISLFLRGTTPLPNSKDPFNWFIPNRECLRAWVRSSGFEIRKEFFHEKSAWQSIRAMKRPRPFAAGLEGYNARAHRRTSS